jgi:transposase-like protein
MDCIRVKVRQDKRVINKAIYIALGINLNGEKEVLGFVFRVVLKVNAHKSPLLT